MPPANVSSHPDSRRTWVEFSSEAAQGNLAFAQKLAASPMPAIMAVIKADGYGHGAIRMAGALAGRVHSFGVACVGEAEFLRSNGIEEAIYLLSPSLPDERNRVIAGNFHPVLSTVEEGNAFNDLAGAAGRCLPVQWSLDTGMGRLGTLPSGMDAMAGQFRSWSHLNLDSICSHFPSADDDEGFTTRQAAGFRATLRRLSHEFSLRPKFVHVSNSAGLLGYPVETAEVVRAGLMLYGTSPLAEFQAKLQPVLTWKTSVSLVRELPEGWGVSYGRTFITRGPTRVATLAAGYADGYPRHLSNQGADVIMHGRRCPLLGRVTMDQLMADVSHLPVPPAPGDEAVLLGKSGNEEITAGELAAKAGTIPWEIYTSIRGARR